MARAGMTDRDSPTIPRTRTDTAACRTRLTPLRDLLSPRRGKMLIDQCFDVTANQEPGKRIWLRSHDRSPSTRELQRR
jgi:hypothetical protein